MRVALLIAFLACLLAQTQAQECPRWDPNGAPVDSISRSITGTVVFHNDLRQWFSLQADAPVCGERIVQLLQDGGAWAVDEKNSRPLEVFRGCRVTSKGALGLPGTTYYSAELYMNVEKIEPAAGCILRPPFTDYSKMKPRPDVRTYRVKLWFDYYGPQGPLHGIATSGSKSLTPWQAYATYSFNGEEDLIAGCAEGYSMSRWWATPQSRPSFDGDRLWVMPEWAAEKHIRHIQLAFSCRR